MWRTYVGGATMFVAIEEYQSDEGGLNGGTYYMTTWMHNDDENDLFLLSMRLLVYILSTSIQ